MIDFITKNYQWIFSGIGVMVISVIITLLTKKRSIKNKIARDSKGIQAGGDITITKQYNDKKQDQI